MTLPVRAPTLLLLLLLLPVAGCGADGDPDADAAAVEGAEPTAPAGFVDALRQFPAAESFRVTCGDVRRMKTVEGSPLDWERLIEVEVGGTTHRFFKVEELHWVTTFESPGLLAGSLTGPFEAAEVEARLAAAGARRVEEEGTVSMRSEGRDLAHFFVEGAVIATSDAAGWIASRARPRVDPSAGLVAELLTQVRLDDMMTLVVGGEVPFAGALGMVVLAHPGRVGLDGTMAVLFETEAAAGEQRAALAAAMAEPSPGGGPEVLEVRCDGRFLVIAMKGLPVR